MDRSLEGASAYSRRQVLQAGAAGLGSWALLSACSKVSGSGGKAASGQAGRTIKIGYVSPQTGALAPFGEADTYVVNSIRQKFAAGLKVGTGTSKIDIVVKDSQSNSQRAGAVASELILNDQVDLMLVASTPETVNPVADQCEANGVPCISSVAPWQAFFFGRGAKAGSSFNWTYHFFWGLEDIEAVYSDMWSQVSTNKKVGALWPNDSDGGSFASAQTGFPAAISKGGYTLVDPGRYENGTQDYSAQIAKYKAGNCEIFTGIPIPPDFTTFWQQAAQQGYRPKLATVAKALLFPSSVEALGPLGNGLATEVWWTPTHPFTSSLTGQTAKALADDYTKTTGKQWTQPIGFVHSLFEVATAAIAKSGAPGDRKALVGALKTLSVNTVCGPLDWGKGPVPNVAKTPLVGGQWRKGTTNPYDLVVVSNRDHPEIPAAGKVQART